MTKLEEIQAAIEELSDEEFAELRRWLSEKDWEAWDGETDENSMSGARGCLIEEAKAAARKDEALSPSAHRILDFAGSWNDMSDEDFDEFLKDIRARREASFSMRQDREGSTA